MRHKACHRRLPVIRLRQKPSRWSSKGLYEGLSKSLLGHPRKGPSNKFRHGLSTSLREVWAATALRGARTSETSDGQPGLSAENVCIGCRSALDSFQYRFPHTDQKTKEHNTYVYMCIYTHQTSVNHNFSQQFGSKLVSKVVVVTILVCFWSTWFSLFLSSVWEQTITSLGSGELCVRHLSTSYQHISRGAICVYKT